MNVKEMSFENRPRERLAKDGPSSLSSAELLAIVLKSGTAKENVIEISNKLLAKYNLDGLACCTLSELRAQYGIGNAKAAQIVAVCELSRRISQKHRPCSKISSAQDVVSLYSPKLSHLPKEHFCAIFLNTKNEVIAEQVVSIGTINSSLVHPREVFNGAIKNLAHSLIIVHNHPSGDPTPSQEDVTITKRLSKAGNVLGVPLLDHIIIGKGKWWSAQEAGVF